MFWGLSTGAARRKAVVADPRGDFAGDVAALMQDRFDVQHVRNWWTALPALLCPLDVLILAADLPVSARRILASVFKQNVPIICLGDIGIDLDAFPSERIVRIDRFPSPNSLSSALEYFFPRTAA